MQAAAPQSTALAAPSLTEMSILDVPVPNAAVLIDALAMNNLANLTPDERLSFLRALCDSVGVNILTAPFAFHTIDGKLVVYATKNCTEQLRNNHKVNIKIVGREFAQGLYIVTAQAQNGLGRSDESIGAVSVEGLKGKFLENAIMKAETKAKRRVTLSLCGLGVLDESEVETMTEIAVEAARGGLQISAAPAETVKPVQIAAPAPTTAPPAAPAAAAPVTTAATPAPAAETAPAATPATPKRRAKKADETPAPVAAPAAAPAQVVVDVKSETVYDANAKDEDGAEEDLSQGETSAESQRWYEMLRNDTWRDVPVPNPFPLAPDIAGKAIGRGEFKVRHFTSLHPSAHAFTGEFKDAFAAMCVPTCERKLVLAAEQTGNTTFEDFLKWSQVNDCGLPACALEEFTADEALRLPFALSQFLANV